MIPGTKRDRLAHWLASTGLLRAGEFLPRRECLIVLNHHRIGDYYATPYDTGTFSVTLEDLDAQLHFLKRVVRCIGLEEAMACIQGKARLGGPAVLLNFDDGYRDNYDLAFPCLRSHGVPAAFFLPTAFIGSDHIPWWDRVAYMVKKSSVRRFAIAYPKPLQCDVAAQGRDMVLLSLFRAYKSPEMTDPERFLAQLSEALECAPPANERLFMEWEHAREMLRAGMGFGSHTHTHELLGKAPPDRQRDELTRSKELIEKHLGIACDAVAYPYGLRSSFTPETMALAREAGYRVGFSFYGGINRPNRIDTFNVFRQTPPGGPKLAYFRTRLLTALVTGRIDF
jgi:peptidoglycan/xylan/chitin deacetylase (PgdA/CDA1 family)